MRGALNSSSILTTSRGSTGRVNAERRMIARDVDVLRSGPRLNEEGTRQISWRRIGQLGRLRVGKGRGVVNIEEVLMLEVRVLKSTELNGILREGGIEVRVLRERLGCGRFSSVEGGGVRVGRECRSRGRVIVREHGK